MAHKDPEEPPTTERSLRNPRRRNRVDSESIKTAPRRKRSKLSATTFLPRDSPEESAEENTQANGHAPTSAPRSYGRQPSASIASGDIELPVRASRNPIKRTHRIEHARTLTENKNYSVKLLNITPKDLQDQSFSFRGSILTHASLALAITKDFAYIWDYNGHTAVSGTKMIELPFRAAAHDPIPLGALVANNTNDIGLILVSATSGKIVYHESIERVASLGFFQEHKPGVEGTITGLFSGEKVVELTSADPAGYVALLSSGRVVHISLRDAQGRPKISTQILYTDDQSTGSLFGSIRNILGTGAWKQAISAVRVRSLERGQVQVLGLMERGEIRLWDLDWSGRYDYRAAIDFREQLQHELRQMRSAERHGDVDYLTLLDIAVLEKTQHASRELVSVASGKPMDAILLVRCGAAGTHTYALVEFSLVGNSFNLARILDITVDAQTQEDSLQARVLVPAPAHTAFVVFPNAVAIMSLATAASQPEAQLHDVSYIEPTPFQDAVYLKSGLNISGGEVDLSRSNGDATGVVFVNGAGLVRINTHDVQIESEEPDTSVRSRIEQAVFYGYQDNNILDLLRAAPKLADQDDVEQAVMSISEDILQSSPEFFQNKGASEIYTNQWARRDAAAHLASYIQRRHPSLSTSVRWRLLFNAERIYAGQMVYELRENSVRSTHGKEIPGVLDEACVIIHRRHPYDTAHPETWEGEILRTFFLTQLMHLGKLLPVSRRILETVRKDVECDPASLLRLVAQALELWLDCLQSAWKFRKDHAADYGLPQDMFDNSSGHDPRDLPELWTSSDDILKDADKIIDLARTALSTTYDEDMQAAPEAEVMKIASDIAKLVDAMCLIYAERIGWCESRGTEKYSSQALRLQGALEVKRHDEIRQLAEVGQVEAGIDMAEKYRDMRTLTELLIAESQYLQESLELVGQEDLSGIQDKMDVIFKKVTDYFDRFGDAFAEAFFEEGFADGNGGKMLTDAHARWQAPMTRWLRKDPSRAKICWINDVLQGDDYKHASRSLFDVAMSREDNTWNKKVELSLAKLSMNAFFEDEPKQARQQAERTNDEIDDELQVVDVQDRFYQHIIPETYHSLDAESALQAAMEAFYGPMLAFGTWHAVLTEHMTMLLAHRTVHLEELLDLITLAESSKPTFEDLDSGRSETFEALVALSAASNLSNARFEVLTKLAWKRAYLREDWENLNAQVGNAQEIQNMLTKTNVYRAFCLVLDAKVTTPKCRMMILEPAETLGAGCHVDDLPNYVSADLKDSILEENVIMERQIEAMIREQSLEHWIRDALELAKRNVLAGQAITDVDALPDKHDGTNGHALNGHANGIKTEDDEDMRALDAFAQATSSEMIVD